MLTTINPNWVADEVAYHYGRSKFEIKPRPSYGKAFPLYVFQGTAIRKDSDEAKAQMAAGYGEKLILKLVTSYDIHLHLLPRMS